MTIANIAAALRNASEEQFAYADDCYASGAYYAAECRSDAGRFIRSTIKEIVLMRPAQALEYLRDLRADWSRGSQPWRWAAEGLSDALPN